MEPIAAPTFEAASSGPWFWLRNFNCSRGELLDHLGQPHWTVPEDGLIYDVDWWFYRAECGLRLSYSMAQDGSSGGLAASLPESQHALRHDRWARANTKARDDDFVESDRAQLIRCLQRETPALQQLQECRVWRMGDDGNPMPVGAPTSEADAKCLVAELERHRHKQVYWYT